MIIEIKPIVQFILILLIGAGIIIGTAWAVSHFEKRVQCECNCPQYDCPQREPTLLNCELYQETCRRIYGEEYLKYSECLKRENLEEELRFLWVVDGAVEDPTFVPMFCEIYKQCQENE